MNRWVKRQGADRIATNLLPRAPCTGRTQLSITQGSHSVYVKCYAGTFPQLLNRRRGQKVTHRYSPSCQKPSNCNAMERIAYKTDSPPFWIVAGMFRCKSVQPLPLIRVRRALFTFRSYHTKISFELVWSHRIPAGFPFLQCCGITILDPLRLRWWSVLFYPTNCRGKRSFRITTFLYSWI